ncbi:aminotransferase class I/II-fold pyridoxal phosphate-dependent enzyme [Pullulanibacillus sp. KACC 23026]|uniref:aminotransferase class I/II-fold pyridoxal phosphate-dependent enzyme n=1 Tax=Pullulanibacillus sp. KACC 23026 TaxID=3028315 RepID=UPI0023B085B0|nr:aminotransferase class I/II-fold pyridoxal phosphate-dependent enzyme [Pullulanibacillus sp. KACC 23026]WEG12196.1 aminotransferase class I/II-fold pyridoxal phosphate-dependent enzyme [Pullulanibacillus sp. KACC 23026]
MIKANKIKALPPNVFVQTEEQKLKAHTLGVKFYDFGIADPSYPSPITAVKTLQADAEIPHYHHYSPLKGHPVFRKQLAIWYQENFNVHLDPNIEILPLLGTKEGLFDICMTYLDKGDVVLIPNPGFPTYFQATSIAGGEIYSMPLLKENQYLPDLKSIPETILKRAKLMFLNYPHNPTGAIAPDSFIEKVIQFAKEHEFIICYDNVFATLTLDGNKPKSFLEYEGAKEVGVEFTSFSKMFNMQGWRIGAVAGNHEVINSLLKMFVEAHTSIFQPIQLAAAAVLREVAQTDFPHQLRTDYQQKVDYGLKKFEEIGWPVERPQGACYLWVPVPDGYSSDEFSGLLFDKYSILTCPGIGFGELGEGFIRLSLTLKMEDCIKGIDKLCEAFKEII